MVLNDKCPKIIFYCRIGGICDVDKKKDDKIKIILNEKLKKIYQQKNILNKI